jgi:cell division protein FtsB
MEELFGMMKLAKAQQEAVQAALDGLAKERAALAKVAGEVKQMVEQGVPAMQKAAGEAVNVSVRRTLGAASEAAAKALTEASRPTFEQFAGVVKAAGQAEESMRKAGAWFAWKWVGVAAGGLVGVCLVAYASLAWQLHQVESLSEQKAALLGEVAELQANVAILAKKGGRIVMRTCDNGRMCIEASSNQGPNYRNWAGPWHSENVQLVIPRGY